MKRTGVAGLILAAVVLGPVSPAAPVSPPSPVDHVHSSSRYNRSPASLAASIARLSPSADLMTLTEVARHARTRVVRRARGFTSYRPGGTDVAIMWRSTWKRLAASSLKLAPGQRAGLVLLQRPDGLRVLVSLAHLPSHVQYGDRWRPTVPNRLHTWRTAVRSWSRQIAAARARWHPDLVIVTADWNVDLRRSHWRRVVTGAFHALHLTWRPPFPRGGTHAGRRIIDGTLTNARGRAHLAKDDRSSDHRPYREKLTPGAP
jgi:hypothetical protein